MNNNKIFILAALGIGAYLLMTKGAYAAPRPGGAYGPLYPSSPPPTTARGQLDQMNNDTLFQVGKFVGGLFGGGASKPAGVLPSGQYTGAYGPPNPYGNIGGVAPGYTSSDYYYGPQQTVNAADYGTTSWAVGPPAPDAYPMNPTGGYDSSAYVPWEG